MKNILSNNTTGINRPQRPRDIPIDNNNTCNQLYATHPPFRNQRSSGGFFPSDSYNNQYCSECGQKSPPISPASNIIRYNRSPRSSYGNNFSRASHDLYSPNDFSETDDFLDASLTASPSQNKFYRIFHVKIKLVFFNCNIQSLKIFLDYLNSQSDFLILLNKSIRIFKYFSRFRS